MLTSVVPAIASAKVFELLPIGMGAAPSMPGAAAPASLETP